MIDMGCSLKEAVMPMLDFAQIKQEHSIVSVAERLNLALKKDGATLRGECPSGAPGDRKFVITPAKNIWYSFAAQKGGDVIALVAFVKGISQREAAAWIVGDTEPEKKKPEPTRTEKVEAGQPSEGFQPLPYLVPDHEMVIAVGFDPDFAATHGIGYAPRGVMRGYVAIPVRDSKGKLLGYCGVHEAKLPTSWHK
jgi:DNA primase